MRLLQTAGIYADNLRGARYTQLMMQPPLTFLTALGRVVVDAIAKGAVGPNGVQANATLAESVWAAWRSAGDDVACRDEIVALAGLSSNDAQSATAKVVTSLSLAKRPELANAGRRYLRHVPSTIRRVLRRPGDPAGRSFPPGWSVRQAADLLKFFPQRVPWFEIGDRPFGVGEWELVELEDVGNWGETWSARPPRPSENPSVALQFFLDPALKDRLRRHGPAVFDRVRELTAQPGWMRLQHAHLDADPPCLEWEYVEAGNLCGVVAEWTADGGKVPHREASVLIQQLAGILARAHRLSPPLVHRALHPGNVLVSRIAGESLECRIALLGISEPLEPIALSLLPFDHIHYLSPQQQQHEPPDPHDDVFALGVLWYQLLTGNVSATRPGGSQWRKRLVDSGVSTTLVELLESCFEDDARSRPADADALETQLGELINPAATSSPAAFGRSSPVDLSALLPTSPTPAAGSTSGRPSSSARPTGKKADVWGMLEGIGEKAQEQAKFITNSLDMKLALVPPGSFSMGSPPAEAGRRDNEGPEHEVLLQNPFYMGVHAVTQWQFQQVCGRNPSKFDADHGGGLDHPVENVTWNEAVEFCQRLSDLPDDKAAGCRYRLPTEAEWEYACRAGTTTLFAFGAGLSADQANFDGNFPHGGAARGLFAEKTLPVGGYQANNFGLFDMHGNVWEWCADWLHGDYYGICPKRNPQGPAAGTVRVLRGGCWRSQAATCRCAYRNGLSPHSRDRFTGFRVVVDAG